MSSQIIIGSRVSGLIGPVIPRENGEEENGDTNCKKHQKWQRYYGTVMASATDASWIVHWDESGQNSIHKSNVLKYESLDINY